MLTLEAEAKRLLGRRIVCTIGVPGDRTHNGANRPKRYRQAMEGDRHWVGCRMDEPTITQTIQTATGQVWKIGRRLHRFSREESTNDGVNSIVTIKLYSKRNSYFLYWIR
jgi:hypothetical protein